MTFSACEGKRCPTAITPNVRVAVSSEKSDHFQFTFVGGVVQWGVSIRVAVFRALSFLFDKESGSFYVAPCSCIMQQKRFSGTRDGALNRAGGPT